VPLGVVAEDWTAIEPATTAPEGIVPRLSFTDEPDPDALTSTGGAEISTVEVAFPGNALNA